MKSTQLASIVRYWIGAEKGGRGCAQRTKLKLWFRRFRPAHKDRRENLPSPEKLQTIFINLTHRNDRLESAKDELRRLGLTNVYRYEAKPHNTPTIGCGESHVAVLQQSLTSNGPLLVCEDDIEFLQPRDYVFQVIEAFLADRRLDVLCLAFNARDIPQPISPLLATTTNTQTTAAYVVKNRAKTLLIDSFGRGLRQLEGGDPSGAIDIAWKQLQCGRLVFTVPRVRVARQMKSYSDIEARITDYGL